MSLSLPGQRAVNGLGSAPSQENRSKVVAGNSPMLVVAIWIERNKVVFEDMQFSFDRLKSFFIRSFCEWATIIPNVNLSFLRGVLGSM